MKLSDKSIWQNFCVHACEVMSDGAARRFYSNARTYPAAGACLAAASVAVYHLRCAPCSDELDFGRADVFGVGRMEPCTGRTAAPMGCPLLAHHDGVHDHDGHCAFAVFAGDLRAIFLSRRHP